MFRTSNTDLSPAYYFSYWPFLGGSSVAVIQALRVMVSYVTFVVIILSAYFFLLVPREGCAWLWTFLGFFIYTGIKHGFSCINIRQIPWEVLKTEAEGRGFQHLPRDLANVNALKNYIA